MGNIILAIVLWALAIIDWRTQDNENTIFPCALPAWFMTIWLLPLLVFWTNLPPAGNVYEAFSKLVDPPITIFNSLWSLLARPAPRRFFRKRLESGLYIFFWLVGFFMKHVVIWLLRWFLGQLQLFFAREWPNANSRPSPAPRRSRGAFSSRSRPPSMSPRGAGRSTSPSAGSSGASGYPSAASGDSAQPPTTPTTSTPSSSSSSAAAGGQSPSRPVTSSFPESPASTPAPAPAPAPLFPAPRRPSDAPEPIPTAKASSEPGPGEQPIRPQRPSGVSEPPPMATGPERGSGQPQQPGLNVAQKKARRPARIVAPFAIPQVAIEALPDTEVPVLVLPTAVPKSPAAAVSTPVERAKTSESSEGTYENVPKVVLASELAAIAIDEPKIPIEHPAETPAVIAQAPVVLYKASKGQSKQSVESITTEHASPSGLTEAKPSFFSAAGESSSVAAKAPVDALRKSAMLALLHGDTEPKSKASRLRDYETMIDAPSKVVKTTEPAKTSAWVIPAELSTAPWFKILGEQDQLVIIEHSSAGQDISAHREVAEAELSRRTALQRQQEELSAPVSESATTTAAAESVAPKDTLEAPWSQILGQSDHAVFLEQMATSNDIFGLQKVAEDELMRRQAEQEPKLPVTVETIPVDYHTASWFQVLADFDQIKVNEIVSSGDVAAFSTARQLAESDLCARIAHQFCLPTPAASDVTLANHASCQSLPAEYSEAVWFTELSSSEKFAVLVASWKGENLLPYQEECISRRRERIAAVLHNGKKAAAPSSVFVVSSSVTPSADVREPVDTSMHSLPADSPAPAPTASVAVPEPEVAQPRRVLQPKPSHKPRPVLPAAAAAAPAPVAARPVSSAAPSQGSASSSQPATKTTPVAKKTFSIFGLSVEGPSGSSTPVGTPTSAAKVVEGPSTKAVSSAILHPSVAVSGPARAKLCPGDSEADATHNPLLDCGSDDAMLIAHKWMLKIWAALRSMEALVDAAVEMSVYDDPTVYFILVQVDLRLRHILAWIEKEEDFARRFGVNAKELWFLSVAKQSELGYTPEDTLEFLFTSLSYELWTDPTDALVGKIIDQLDSLSKAVGRPITPSVAENTALYKDRWFLSVP